MRAADWLEITDALRIMLEHTSPLGPETVALDDASGRTLAERVVSPIDQPPWDNSAMDGFAVISADVRGARPDEPIALSVIEEIPAGALPQRALSRGQASRIMTGAPLPEGADGVIRIEHTTMVDDRVAVLRDDDAGRNVRHRGEDVRTGDTVLEQGRLLRAVEIGALAMVGRTHPVVYRRPRVALLATGDELVEPERIADVIAATHIVNSNTPALAAGLRATDCEPVPLGIARDDLAELGARLDRALDEDALITTAGASVGDHDFVKDALGAIGCEVLFWRVKIRPGSPFSFGLLRGRHGRTVPVFGLPGNPVSALITFEILVRPVLRAMLGRTRLYPVVEHARAGEDIRSPAGLVRFLRVRLETGSDGIRRAYLTGPQGSGILTSLTAADALLIVPLETKLVPAQTPVRVVPLRGADDAQELIDLT
ncbi:MAG TPA: gephyrin-like molybdotransferase Glp [Longimicrobiales bacterium]